MGVAGALLSNNPGFLSLFFDVGLVHLAENRIFVDFTKTKYGK